MYYPTRGTSAYKPEVVAPQKQRQKTAVTKKVVQKKVKSHRVQSIIAIAAVFLLVFAYLSRSVHIYGQRDEITKKTQELETLQMANDQLSVEIKSLTDSSRIEQYASEHLNLKKMDSNQIVYLDQTTEDNMQRMTKNNGSNIFKGIFGLFAGVVEYLR